MRSPFISGLLRAFGGQWCGGNRPDRETGDGSSPRSLASFLGRPPGGWREANRRMMTSEPVRVDLEGVPALSPSLRFWPNKDASHFFSGMMELPFDSSGQIIAEGQPVPFSPGQRGTLTFSQGWRRVEPSPCASALASPLLLPLLPPHHSSLGLHPGPPSLATCRPPLCLLEDQMPQVASGITSGCSHRKVKSDHCLCPSWQEPRSRALTLPVPECKGGRDRLRGTGMSSCRPRAWPCQPRLTGDRLREAG